MMDFELDPPRGVGAVRLGMTRDDAERVLGDWGEPRPFRRGPEGSTGWVVERAATVFVYCDDDGIVDGVEFATPGFGTPGLDRVWFRGVDVFASPVAEVLSAFADMDLVVTETEEGSSYTVLDLTLALWRSGGPEDEAGLPKYFEAALVARPGYYG